MSLPGRESQRGGLESLTREECLALLRHAPIGRVAVVVAGIPVVVPVNFTMFQGDIVFRTAIGTKLLAAVGHGVVSFEVDHVDAAKRSGWSVLVTGRADEVVESSEVDAIRAAGLESWAPDRDHFVRIRAEALSGRRLRPDGARRAAFDREWDWT